MSNAENEADKLYDDFIQSYNDLGKKNIIKSYSIPKHLIEPLNARAKIEGLSNSKLVAKIIQEYLAANHT